MEEKIKQKLDEYDLTIDDLTSGELERLKEEIRLEEIGYVILDGVLSSIPPYRAK